MSHAKLAVLDLVPISSGSTPAQAICNSIDLAQKAEELGYVRFWFAEHHLNPGVAGTSPVITIALAAAATTSIRIGSGALQMGHRTALCAVEEFGLLDAVYPGRLDFGLGRSVGQPSVPVEVPALPGTEVVGGRAANGLPIPRAFDPRRLTASPRVAMQRALLQQPQAVGQPYPDQVRDVLALLAGTYQNAAGTEGHVVPGEGARVEVWILGSSGGESANVAGEHGLPFAANYHVAPAKVLEAVAGYRAAFRPGKVGRAYVAVSADVVVAQDARAARELATGYRNWVRSIRSAEGAILYPTPAEASALPWTEADELLVADRLETRFVGTSEQVADQLAQLQDATGADELIVTTITHDHVDRVRSYELLAQEWAKRS